MRDQIVMSKTNGQCASAVPLFRWNFGDEIADAGVYKISVVATESTPLAYIIDGGAAMGEPQVLGARFVLKHLDFIGDL